MTTNLYLIYFAKSQIDENQCTDQNNPGIYHVSSICNSSKYHAGHLYQVYRIATIQIVYMLHVSLLFFHQLLLLWHCTNVVSKIPYNSKYGTIQNKYINSLKVKICFADIVNYSQGNGPGALQFEITWLTVYAINMRLTTWKKNNINKTKKTKKIQPLPGNRH